MYFRSKIGHVKPKLGGELDYSDPNAWGYFLRTYRFRPDGLVTGPFVTEDTGATAEPLGPILETKEMPGPYDVDNTTWILHNGIIRPANIRENRGFSGLGMLHPITSIFDRSVYSDFVPSELTSYEPPWYLTHLDASGEPLVGREHLRDASDTSAFSKIQDSFRELEAKHPDKAWSKFTLPKNSPAFEEYNGKWDNFMRSVLNYITHDSDLKEGATTAALYHLMNSSNRKEAFSKMPKAFDFAKLNSNINNLVNMIANTKERRPKYFSELPDDLQNKILHNQNKGIEKSWGLPLPNGKYLGSNGRPIDFRYSNDYLNWLGTGYSTKWLLKDAITDAIKLPKNYTPSTGRDMLVLCEAPVRDLFTVDDILNNRLTVNHDSGNETIFRTVNPLRIIDNANSLVRDFFKYRDQYPKVPAKQIVEDLFKYNSKYGYSDAFLKHIYKDMSNAATRGIKHSNIVNSLKEFRQ